MFELIGASKRRKTSYQQIGEIKAPTEGGGGSDYGQNAGVFRFYWAAQSTYYDIRYVRVIRRDGTVLQPGVDWTASASSVYSSAYPVSAVYNETASYWCSVTNGTNQWFQITLTNPADKLDRIEIMQPTYANTPPIIRQLDSATSTWVNVKTFNTPTFALGINYSMYFGNDEGRPSLDPVLMAALNAFNGTLRTAWSMTAGTPGGTLNSYSYINSLVSSPIGNGSVWGNYLNDYVCGGSAVGNSINQALPESRLLQDLNGKRILLHLKGVGTVPNFRAITRNGIMSNVYGPYEGSACYAIVYFDPKFGWYVRANPWDMTIEAFDPRYEMTPWK